MIATEMIQRMEDYDNNLADDIESEEDCAQAFDFWSDAGVRCFNEALDEGSAYLEANPRSIANYKEDFDGEECEYPHPDHNDAEEETLLPGEMELIFENSFIL